MMTNHSYPPDKCTFELLSAYLDGEVTAKQREEVQNLLSSDPEIQKLYSRLLNLREELNNLPIPSPSYTSQQLSESVFARVDQERKKRKMYLWGGGAIATVAVTTILGIFNGGNRSPLWQMAQQNNSTTTEEALVIALHEPIISLNNTSEGLMIPLDHSVIDFGLEQK